MGIGPLEKHCWHSLSSRHTLPSRINECQFSLWKGDSGHVVGVSFDPDCPPNPCCFLFPLIPYRGSAVSAWLIPSHLFLYMSNTWRADCPRAALPSGSAQRPGGSSLSRMGVLPLYNAVTYQLPSSSTSLVSEKNSVMSSGLYMME